MTRRELIAILGTTAAAWPLAARAQQPTVPVIGFMSTRSPAEAASDLATFRQGVIRRAILTPLSRGLFSFWPASPSGGISRRRRRTQRGPGGKQPGREVDSVVSIEFMYSKDLAPLVRQAHSHHDPRACVYADQSQRHHAAGAVKSARSECRAKLLFQAPYQGVTKYSRLRRSHSKPCMLTSRVTDD